MARFGVGQLVDIEMLGDKKLQRTLNRMDLRVQAKGMAKALRAGGKPILADAKARARAAHNPATPSTNMLKVARGLKLRKAKGRRRGVIGMRILTPTKAELGIPEGSKWYYPAHVELGSGPTKRGRPAVPAIPYMRGALHAGRQSALRRIRVHLWRFIRAQARATA